MARKRSSMKQIGFILSLLFILGFATIRANLSTATAEPENNMNLKDTQITLKKTVNDLVQRTEELEKRSIQQEEKFKELKASMPRSFFGKKIEQRSISGRIILDELEIECKGRPIVFFLMPAVKQDEIANIDNRYRGGSGAALKILRFRNNKEITVSSLDWMDGHDGIKRFSGSIFLGIDETPEFGNSVYKLEIKPDGTPTTIHNVKFAAFELPQKVK